MLLAEVNTLSGKERSQMLKVLLDSDASSSIVSSKLAICQSTISVISYNSTTTTMSLVFVGSIGGRTEGRWILATIN